MTASRTTDSATWPPPQMTSRGAPPNFSTKIRLFSRVRMPLAPHPASAGRFRASRPSGLAGQTGTPSQRRSLAPLSGPSSTEASVCCPCVLRKASKNSRIDIEFLHYGLLLHRCGSIVARIVQLRLPRLPVLGQHPPAEPAACRDLTGQRDEPPRDPPGGALFLPAIARAVEANERTMYCLLRRISALLGSSQTASAALSTSASVFWWEKLNRTIPCSTVPRALWMRGAQ